MKKITLLTSAIVILITMLYHSQALKAQMMGSPETRTLPTSSTWMMMSAIEYGYFASNRTANDSLEGSNGSYWDNEYASFAMGFEKLAGIGFGLKVFEGSSKSKDYPGTPTSWFPLYVYYPIVISNLGYDDYFYHNIYGYVYLGGSAWGVKTNKYYNLGVKGGYNFIFSGVAVGVYIKGGYYSSSSDYYSDNQSSLYFGVGITLYNIMNAKD